jgi:hypothetical protein
MVADRPYDEFYDFYSNSLQYFGYHHIYRYSNVHVFPQNVQTGSGAHPTSSLMGNGGAFPSRYSSTDIQLSIRTKQVLRLATNLNFLVPMIH